VLYIKIHPDILITQNTKFNYLLNYIQQGAFKTELLQTLFNVVANRNMWMCLLLYILQWVSIRRLLYKQIMNDSILKHS